MRNALFILLQRIVPQHGLSRLIGKLAECRISSIKNCLIRQFIRHFQVDMSQSQIEDYRQFENFNAFFTRELKPEARPICSDKLSIACPADGNISEIGDISLASILQAKGQSYSLMSLLAGDAELCNTFLGGKFATIYLSPRDYHRVHMPLDGSLRKMTYVPGKLFSVNQVTADRVPGLFARNERLICEFDGKHGPFVVILVGAMIVAGIETVWAGQIAPVKPQLFSRHYPDKTRITLKKGDELGRFKLGSTAILLLPANSADWNNALANASPTVMGQSIGQLTP